MQSSGLPEATKDEEKFSDMIQTILKDLSGSNLEGRANRGANSRELDVDGILPPWRNELTPDIGRDEGLLRHGSDEDLSLGTRWRLLSLRNRNDPDRLSVRAWNDCARTNSVDGLLRDGSRGSWRSGRRSKGRQRRNVDLLSVGGKEVAVGDDGSSDRLERPGRLDLGTVNVVLTVHERRRAEVRRGVDSGRAHRSYLGLVGHAREPGLEWWEAHPDGFPSRLARKHLQIGELGLLGTRTQQRRAGNSRLEWNSGLRAAYDCGRRWWSLLSVGRLRPERDESLRGRRPATCNVLGWLCSNTC